MSGALRRELLVRFALAGPAPRVDVGADHGRVAAAIGAIATERRPHRRAAGGRWVIADGLAPFRAVGTAVIAGMGARTIARILGGGTPVACAVLHAQDEPRWLRSWLAANGWRIVDEALAPEARGFAEVIRAEPGHEPTQGLLLEYGPVLLASADPLLAAHLDRELTRLRGLTLADLPAGPRAALLERVGFLTSVREGLPGP